jgi:archaellin
MPLLSKSEILFLQGQKQVSKSYKYKLRSIIRKKVANLLDKEVPLLSSLFPKLNLTEIGKTYNYNHLNEDLTKNSKTTTNKTITNYSSKVNENYNNSIKNQENTENSSQVIARPRFELGSKAPKASMLVRYIRYSLI